MMCFHFIFANKKKYDKPIYHFISFFREMWIIRLSLQGTIQDTCAASLIAFDANIRF